jgi:hypothetical protein
MARARNIKPSIFKNELLGVADPLVTLLFISLWTLADKQGRLEDRPLRIRGETFPYRENLDVNGYLTELVALGFIVRYEVDGVKIIEVVNFTKHQTPHSTEKQSELPANPIGRPLTVILPLNNESASVISHINVLIPDSLIPDSLIPDSLIPDSLIPDSLKKPNSKTMRETRLIIPPVQVPDWMPVDAWNDFVESRRKIRKPMTQNAIKLAISTLSKLKSEGNNVQEVIEQSILCGYSGLFPVSKGKKQSVTDQNRSAVEEIKLRLRQQDQQQGETYEHA